MKRLAICTGNIEYDVKLQEYLGNRIGNEYLIMIFSDRDKLLTENKKEKLDALILDESIWREIFANERKANGKRYSPEKNFGNIVCLCENTALEEECFQNVKKMYRYSPGMEILTEIDYEKVEVPGRRGNENTNYDTASYNNAHSKAHSDIEAYVIGIYSPVGGSGVTSLSLASAEVLSRRGKVLYISLESFSPVTELLYLDDRYTLSEALYSFMAERNSSFAKAVCDGENANTYLSSPLPGKSPDRGISAIRPYIGKTADYNTIAPVRSFCELSKVTEADWKQFFEMIVHSEEFDYLIIELSDTVDGLFSIMEMCSLVLIPERENMDNPYKMRAFSDEMKRRVTTDFYESTLRFLTVPEFLYQDFGYENISETGYGKWVKQIYAKL